MAWIQAVRRPDALVRVVYLVHLGATLCMVGIIWFVQVSHYPGMANIGESHFVEFERRNIELTRQVVGPLMLAEGITAVLLLWLRPKSIPVWAFVAGLILLLVAGLSTALIQVPCHQRLAERFDASVHAHLVETNWIRTLAWSARGLLVLWMMELRTAGASRMPAE